MKYEDRKHNCAYICDIKIWFEKRTANDTLFSLLLYYILRRGLTTLSELYINSDDHRLRFLSYGYCRVDLPCLHISCYKDYNFSHRWSIPKLVYNAVTCMKVFYLPIHILNNIPILRLRLY